MPRCVNHHHVLPYKAVADAPVWLGNKQVALRRFQWGRHLSLLYMTLAYFLNYMWTRVPSAAFFHYCHVTPVRGA